MKTGEHKQQKSIACVIVWNSWAMCPDDILMCKHFIYLFTLIVLFGKYTFPSSSVHCSYRFLIAEHLNNDYTYAFFTAYYYLCRIFTYVRYHCRYYTVLCAFLLLNLFGYISHPSLALFYAFPSPDSSLFPSFALWSPVSCLNETCNN